MVAAGMGVTLVPRLSVPKEALDARPRRRKDDPAFVRYIPFDGDPPTRRVVLAWRRSFTRYEAIAALRNADLCLRAAGREAPVLSEAASRARIHPDPTFFRPCPTPRPRLATNPASWKACPASPATCCSRWPATSNPRRRSRRRSTASRRWSTAAMWSSASAPCAGRGPGRPCPRPARVSCRHVGAGVKVPSTPGHAVVLGARRRPGRPAARHAPGAEGARAGVHAAPRGRCLPASRSATSGHGRDLTGFEDGTENPKGDEALRPPRSRTAWAQGLDGSSFVAVQQWVHDLDAFEAHGRQDAQNHCIGRRAVRQRGDRGRADLGPRQAHGAGELRARGVRAAPLHALAGQHAGRADVRRLRQLVRRLRGADAPHGRAWTTASSTRMFQHLQAGHRRVLLVPADARRQARPAALGFS